MTTDGSIDGATLTRVADGLRAEGYTTNVEGETLSVDLPMFSCVKVEAGPARAKPYAKFGMVRRGTATLTTIAMVAAGSWVSMAPGMPTGLLLALLVGALAWDAVRWVITQRALNRVEQLLSAPTREG